MHYRHHVPVPIFRVQCAHCVFPCLRRFLRGGLFDSLHISSIAQMQALCRRPPGAQQYAYRAPALGLAMSARGVAPGAGARVRNFPRAIVTEPVRPRDLLPY